MLYRLSISSMVSPVISEISMAGSPFSFIFLAFVMRSSARPSARPFSSAPEMAL